MPAPRPTPGVCAADTSSRLRILCGPLSHKSDSAWWQLTYAAPAPYLQLVMQHLHVSRPAHHMVGFCLAFNATDNQIRCLSALVWLRCLAAAHRRRRLPLPHPHHHFLLHRQFSKQQQQHSSSRRTIAARLRCARSTPPPCSALQRWSSGELLGLGNCNSFLCKQREGLVCVPAGPTSCRIIQQAVATASGSSCCRR